jgi:hypothetical protein
VTDEILVKRLERELRSAMKGRNGRLSGESRIDEGDEWFAVGFRFLLLRAVAIGRRRDALKDSTPVQYHGDLERRLDRLLVGDAPDKPVARRLFRAVRRDRDDRFSFITRRDVPCTNCACERSLRPSVLFGKVAGGFRAEWGAKVMLPLQASLLLGACIELTALGGYAQLSQVSRSCALAETQ